MKEMIMKAFKALGFELEELGELGYGFEYEGVHYLWLADGGDDMLSLCIPAVLNKDNEEEQTFYHIMDKFNSSLKFIKANAVGDGMWLFYERELVGGEDFDKLIPRMILHLDHAYRMLIGAGNDEDKAEPNAVEPLSDDVRIVVSDGVRKVVSDGVKSEVSDEGTCYNLIFDMPD